MRLLPALAVLLMVAPACNDAGSETGGAATSQSFTVDLRPLNGSEAEGRGELSLDGNQLTVDIEATGLEPDRTHEQHLQGLAVAGQEATCPSDSEDSDGDRLVDLGEARSAFGPSIRALEPFPTVGGGGRLDYELGFTIKRESLEPLENRVLVLRGLSSDRRGNSSRAYVPDLPVACGDIRAVGVEAVTP